MRSHLSGCNLFSQLTLYRVEGFLKLDISCLALFMLLITRISYEVDFYAFFTPHPAVYCLPVANTLARPQMSIIPYSVMNYIQG